VNGFGFFPEFKRINVGSLGSLTSLSGLTSQYYKLKLVTERGNTYECQVPYPPPSSGGGQLGGYVLQIDNDQNNFQYATGMMTSYGAAYSVPKGAPCLYRVLIRNMSPNLILLHRNSTMSMMEGAVGQVIYSYIVATSNDVMTRGPIMDEKGKPIPPDPYVDDSLTISPGQHVYVYFGAKTQGGNEWAINPGHDFLAAFILVFHYPGDPTYRTVPTPVIYVVVK